MAEDKKYFRIRDLDRDEVTEMYRQGFAKGYECGYETGDKFLSYRLGYHTLLYGHPYSGKTQWAIEQMIYLSRSQGVKHLIYLPENGRKNEIIGDILMVYLGQKMFGDDVPDVDIDKLNDALKFIDEYFIVVYPIDGVLTMNDAYNVVRQVRKDEGFDVNMLWIDHFGYLTKNGQYFNIADYVKDSMQLMLRASLKLNIHTVLFAHIRDIEPVTDKETGIKYMPRPHASEVAGGQQNWNNGYQMVGFWRCPQGVIDPESGMPYLHNEARVIIQKSKPKGVGRVGEFKLVFNEHKQAFQEVIGSSLYRIGEYKSYNSAPELNLRPTVDGDDLPF